MVNRMQIKSVDTDVSEMLCNGWQGKFPQRRRQGSKVGCREGEVATERRYPRETAKWKELGRLAGSREGAGAIDAFN